MQQSPLPLIQYWINLLKRILLCLLLFSNVAFAAKHYHFDESNTTVTWFAKHILVYHPYGHWQASGDLFLDDKNANKSYLNVTINMTSLKTGISTVDKYLNSAFVFDAATYPTATFASHHISMLDKHHAKVTGTLTLHGQTHPVTLDVTSDTFEGDALQFNASTTINREDFGIKPMIPGLNNEVNVIIESTP